MSARHPRSAVGSRARAGLTLVELIVASGLAAILMVAVFRLLDVSLDLWSRGETRRNLVEQGAATAELFARDLRAVHGGQQGDLLVEWQPFDTDGDSVVDRVWPRLRLVRQATAADLARLAAAERRLLEGDPAERGDEAADADAGEPDPAAARPTPPASGLVEIAWAVLPAARSGEERLEGVLWRGERALDPGSPGTFFAPSFFGADGRPPAGALNEVTGGILWLRFLFAAQTSIVHDGWELGDELDDATASWDAWRKGRPSLDLELCFWNEPHPGMPAVEDVPLLPRRVRVELEFESARDRRRRTRLAADVERDSLFLLVENGAQVPRRPGAHVLVGQEWMEIVSVRDERVNVRRGVRATRARTHSTGALVHHGEPVVTEVPIPLYSDDWNL